MNKYIYILTILFLTTSIFGLLYSYKITYNLDPLISEIKHDAEVVAASKLLSILRNDKASLVNNMNWEDFQQLAKGIAKDYGIPVSVMLGMAAIESGHGTSYRARVHKNYFGLGASDNSSGLKFDSVEGGIRYYAELIAKGNRYRLAYSLRAKPKEMLQKIWEAGYAVDQNYVAKVISTKEFQENL